MTFFRERFFRLQMLVSALRGGSRFRRNLTSVALANVVAQLLVVIAAPLLTRLYSPDDFGAFGVFSAGMGIALAVGTGWFEWLVPNPRTAAQGAALFWLGSAVLGVTCLVIALAAARWAVELPGDEWARLAPFWWMFPLVLAASGAQQLLLAWHIRGADLRRMSWLRVTQTCTNAAVAAGLGWWLGPRDGPFGLLAGVLAGAVISTVGLGWRAPGLAAATGALSFNRFGVAWRRYRYQAGWSSVATVLSSLNAAIVPLLLARHYAAADVGLYVLAQRIALTPLGTVTSAVHRSFWAEAARLVHTDQSALKALFHASARKLLLLSVPVVAVALTGPLFVGPVFGKGHWDGAGWLLLVSIPMIVGQLVIAPLTHLGVRGRQHWQASWDALRLVVLGLTAEWAGRSGVSVTTTVAAISLVYAASYATLYQLNVRAMARDARRGSEVARGAVVVHVSSVHRRDDIRIFHKQCRSLATAGYEVHLFVGDGRGDAEASGVRIHDVGAVSGRLQRMLVQPWRLYRSIAPLRAAVYHFHDPELLPVAWWMAGDARVIYDAHEDLPRAVLSKHWIPAVSRGAVALACRALENWVAARLDGVSAATPHIAQRFRSLNRRAVAINNYPLAEELARPAGRGERGRNVCYVGGLSLIRGAVEMVRAIALTDARLLLAGPFDGPETEARCRAEPGWAQVDYLGVVVRQRVREIFTRSAVGLLLFHPEPNHLDAQPNKLFEYMAAGLPIVAANFPLWRRVIEGQGAGICVDPLDPSAIAAAIFALLDDPVSARAMGERGRAAVAGQYQWNSEAAKLCRLYRDLQVVPAAP